MNIDEIKKLGDKAPIATPIEATVLEAFEQKEIGGKWPKKVQRIKLDQGGTWIFTECENHPDFKSLEGQTIRIESGTDREGNPCGVYAHKTEWNGKTYDNLRLTKSAKIIADGTASVPAAQPSTQSQTPRTEPHTQSQQAPVKNMMWVRRELNRSANLLLLCYDAMSYVRDSLKGHEISDEAFEQKVTGMWIEANRKGLIEGVKPGTLDAPNPTPAPKKEPEQEAGVKETFYPNEDEADDIPY